MNANKYIDIFVVWTSSFFCHFHHEGFTIRSSMFTVYLQGGLKFFKYQLHRARIPYQFARGDIWSNSTVHKAAAFTERREFSDTYADGEYIFFKRKICQLRPDIWCQHTAHDNLHPLLVLRIFYLILKKVQGGRLFLSLASF